MEIRDVNGYAAFKNGLFCEECYPDGVEGLGSFTLATKAYTDPNGRNRYRCVGHAPPAWETS